jgi:hypothetical protein
LFELRGGKFVSGPGGDFAGGVVAEDEGLARGEFEVRGIAGGKAEAIGLGGEDGEQSGE